jgi:putative transposase
VSRSAFKDRLHRRPSAHQASAKLTEKIRQVHTSSRGTYGAHRVHAELRELGWHVGKKRVARLRVAAGLAGDSRSVFGRR